MTSKDKADRCGDCGGPATCCSSPVGCGGVGNEVAVNVAYAAGVKDELDRILALIATLHRKTVDYVGGDDRRAALSELRALVTKAVE